MEVFSNAYSLCRTRSPRYVEHQCFKLAILNSLYGIWWTCYEYLHFIPSNSSIPLRLSVSYFVVVVESFENDRNVLITCIANSHFHGNIVTNIPNSQSNTISLCMWFMTGLKTSSSYKINQIIIAFEYKIEY